MIEFIYTACHDFRKLAYLIRRHGLYEKSHRGSRFKELSDDILSDGVPSSFAHVDFITIKQFSTVVCTVDNQPVGLVIFEHYLLNDSVRTHFTSRGKKRSYSMHGLLGAYVKPSMRNQGIAKQMIQQMSEVLCSQYVNTSHHVNFISATSHTLTIALECFEGVRLLPSPYNSKTWMTAAKDHFTYHINDRLMEPELSTV